MTLPKTTEKHGEIITLIHRFRFLDRSHIQRILNHKNPSTINIWLSYLTKHNFLKKDYSKKFPENTKPAVFHMGTKGIQFIRNTIDPEKEKSQKLYNEKHRTPYFKTKCLALADFACNLLVLSLKYHRKAELLTKVDYMKDSDEDLLLFLQKLQPDAYYSYSGSGIAKAAFVEVIEEYKPGHVLQKKVRRYFQVLNNGDWDAVSDDKFPSLIFILPSIKKLQSLQYFIKRIRRDFDDEELDTEIRCNLTLASELQTRSIADPIWKKA